MKKSYFRLCFLATLMLCTVAIGAPHKIRVDDRAVTQSLLAKGGKLVADYGAFQVLEADDAVLGGAATNKVEVRDDMNLIRLNVQTLDTRAPQVKALRKTRGQFGGKRTHLVQFGGPIKPEWHEALLQTGVRVVTYIPENAYLVYGDSAALAQLQSWASNADYVQWEGEYADDYKIHPKARNTDDRGNPRDIGTDLFSVQLIVDTNANRATLAVIDRLKLEAAVQDYELDGYRNITIALPPGRLNEVAAQPDVISIQPHFIPKKRDERQAQIMAGAVSGGSLTGPGYLTWLTSKGFTQAQFTSSGFIVDVADSGVDNGTATPGHFALYTRGDISKSDRLSYARLEGSKNPGSSLAGCDGHGALNAHIIGGYVNLSGFPHTDSFGYEYDLGICPFVKLGSSVVFDPNNWTSPNYNQLASDAYKSGARISNNSWGADVGGDYDFDAQTYDRLVRDAQFGVAGNQQMIFVFAAGNAGPCTTNFLGIDSPGSAKNVITVGAAESVRPITAATGGNNTSGDFCSDNSEADNADDVDCFSSQGPCSDGRMKPDLVAPGTHITGGVGQVRPPPSPSSLGDAISCFDAFGVCALPHSGGTGNPNNFFPLGQQFYTVSTGTSHATPAVSGACALVRQYFLNKSQIAPSPAMTKAFLINSARYLTGANAGDTLWSPSQGMGEVNLGTAFDGLARILRDQIAAEIFTAPGQTLSYSGTIVDSSKPFRVTIAWTDAPGNPTANSALVNNLDLTVTIGGNTYKGNVFSGQYSASGGTADTKNNVESVFLPPGLSGDFTVTLTAANINSDAITFNGSPQQDFALVIYNASSVSISNPPPPFAPQNGTYSGLFYGPTGPTLGRSGAIAVKTTSAGAYSGTLQVGASRGSFSGLFNSSGAATNVVIVNNMALTLGMQMNITNNSALTGTVKGLTWTATMLANRAIFSVTTNPAPFAGHYTMVIPGTAGLSELPQGDSYGTVAVDGAGKVKLTGALADGTKLSQSAVASAGGLWPLYVPLYKGAGQVLGWLAFTNGGLGGNVDWIKSAIPTAKYYPAGFDDNTTVIGSAFVSSPNVLPDFSNGLLILDGPTVGVANQVNFTASHMINLSSNKLSFSVSTTTGLFKGSVVNPANGKTIPFSGVVLQSQDYGSGYFLETNQSGRVSFSP